MEEESSKRRLHSQRLENGNIMSKKTNLYIGIAFLVYGIFEIVENRPDESVLYLMIGSAFGITWFSYRENLSPTVKKVMVIGSWILIGASLIWFLYLVRTDSWR